MALSGHIYLKNMNRQSRVLIYIGNNTSHSKTTNTGSGVTFQPWERTSSERTAQAPQLGPSSPPPLPWKHTKHRAWRWLLALWHSSSLPGRGIVVFRYTGQSVPGVARSGHSSFTVSFEQGLRRPPSTVFPSETVGTFFT